MNKTVCVDASFVVALLAPERYTASAIALWEIWMQDDIEVLVPTLLNYEVTSALYRKAFTGKYAAEDAHAALQQFLKLDIESIYLPELNLTASALAKQYNRPNTYDAHYLALAEHFACPLWTADERLYNVVKGKFEFIKWIED